MVQKQILSLLGVKLRQAIEKTDPDWEYLQEIRIRVGQPLILLEKTKEHVIDTEVSLKDLSDIVEAACGYSGYAFEEEIRKGYITIAGGHRIGLTGRAVLSEKGIQTLKYISALNVRVAHPIKGCAEKWRDYFYIGGNPCHTLLISPPGGGKTTMLRDAVRMLANGTEKYQGVTVGVVDERSEIAGIYRGLPTHDLGIRTDVLDGCPKSLGMEMLLRSMAPKVIAVDEIGVNDVPAIENALRCGCRILATLHGETIQDFLQKPGFFTLVQNKVFERYLFLSQRKMTAVFDQEMEQIF